MGVLVSTVRFEASGWLFWSVLFAGASLRKPYFEPRVRFEGRAMENILYVGIARIRDRLSISEFCAVDLADVPSSLMHGKLKKVLSSERVREHNRLTITDREVGSIHYDSDLSCIYFVIARRDYSQRTAFKFLGEVQARFDSEFGQSVVSASEGSLSSPSRKLLAALCKKYNTGANMDKISSVSLQVDEVKGQMNENIQGSLRNNDALTNLVNESDSMANDANSFKRSARDAKNKMWYKNAKYQVLIALALALLLVFIIVPIVKTKQPASTSTRVDIAGDKAGHDVGRIETARDALQT